MMRLKHSICAVFFRTGFMVYPQYIYFPPPDGCSPEKVHTVMDETVKLNRKMN